MMALKYHPDKNKGENASQQFQEVQNAYEYLEWATRDTFGDERDEEKDANEAEESELESESAERTSASEKKPDILYASYYGNLLRTFIAGVLSTTMGIDVSDSTHTLICNIVSKIMESGEAHSIEYLKKIDKSVLLKIYEIVCKYRDVLHLNDAFLDKIKELVSSKFENDECILLNPFIDDLFDDNVYKLKENGHTYIVPLWHHELVYDNSGADLYVKCIPLLPENCVIDAYNNIHVVLKWNISSVWEKYEIPVSLGKRTFRIPLKDLRVLKHQCITLREAGISRVNTKNIYDVSRRGDIVFHIELVLA